MLLHHKLHFAAGAAVAVYYGNVHASTPAGNIQFGLLLPFVNLLDGDREIMIFDLTGRLILKQKINPHESESFQVTDLNKGSYLIQIKSAKAYRTAKVLVL